MSAQLALSFEPRRVFLVACVGQKLTAPAPAKKLYQSMWFRKARAYVEAQGGEWSILSALYGLVSSEQTIAPYDCTLNTMSATERRSWTDKVLAQLAMEPGTEVVILAGRHYRAGLVEALEARGHKVTVPMAGLGIGEQLAWLNQSIASLASEEK